MAYSPEIKQEAKTLFLKKFTPPEIGERLNVPKRTVYDWVKAQGWANLLSHETAEEALATRINILAYREGKSERELKEFKICCSQLLELRKVELENTRLKLMESGKEGGEHSEKNNKRRKKKSKKVKNDIGHLTQADFEKEFHSKLYWHQKVLHDNKDIRNREVQKPRQGGYTWYFAGEAFERAVLKGHNCNFVSASRSQAEIFLAYIRAMASEWFNIELTGNPLVLSNGAILRPVSTNGRTAQGYTGHVYMDEYSWIPKFDELYKLAGAMATHHQWTRTLFSTPSSKQHQAYAHWTARVWKQEHPRNKKPWPTASELADSGRMCPDGTWRFACTIETLVEKGFDKVKLSDIKQENSKADYQNLYMLLWIDGQESAFDVDLLNRCVVDSKRRWRDVDHNLEKPYSNKPVRIGYDPSRTKDNACIVVLAEPLTVGGKHRVIEKLTWNNVSFEFQAKQIEKLIHKYNVTFIGIDVTGIGYGVYELIKKIKRFPESRIKPITYSTETKTELVLKAENVIKMKRLQYDAEHKGISAAFLTVKKKVTSGGAITYASNRSAETGHADEAWAVMNALSGEPITYQTKTRSTW